MEKRKTHHDLKAIKAAFDNADTLNRTYSSRQGADEPGIDDDTLVEIIQALSRSDFHKSMTSKQDHRVWQDVYKPTAGKIGLYVNITLDVMKQFPLISFKEADDEQS